MKKKIALMLSFVMAFAFLLSACGTDPTKVDYNGKSYTDLYDESSNLIDNLSVMDEDTLSYYLSAGDELTTSIITSWQENTADLGDYVGYSDFKVTKSGSTLTTDMTVEFTKRDVDFQIVYNYNSIDVPTGVTVEPIQSLGEKMSKAGLNTIISMLIVFAVLVLISLIIYAFNIFPYLEKRKKEKQESADAVKDQVVNQIELREQMSAQAAAATDDTELIAVIAAAIAASTGTSTSDFVVRSINRR